ncbi:MAG: hypothetical protein CM1200mP2_15060 [Planctomycetaceae bacterium]|nr:MAG: hypothetical protein CM1200mP2_15060 [Planctomycetaceae bacterium]
MKIRIFKLAKELGLDHKELVEICGEVGVLVKSSPLASITAEQKDLVTEHLKSRSAPKPPEDDAAPLAPIREAGDGAANRIRSMRTMTARPTPRVRPKAVAEPDEPVEAVPETAGAEEADAAADQAPESPTGQVTWRQAIPVRVQLETNRRSPAKTMLLLTETTARDSAVGSATGPRNDCASQPSTQGQDDFAQRAAPPAYQPPEAREKTSEEDSVGTQKPDIRLTAETMQQSPLAAHLRKSTEQKRKGDEGETVAPAAPTGGRRRGSLRKNAVSAGWDSRNHGSGGESATKDRRRRRAGATRARDAATAVSVWPG